MKRYHVNKQGNPGVCRAQAGRCPLGEDLPHFSTPDEARGAYEASMNDQGLASVTSLAVFRQNRDGDKVSVEQFETAWQTCPKFFLSSALESAAVKAGRGEKVSPKNLDQIIHDLKPHTRQTPFNKAAEAEAASLVLQRLIEVRAQDSTPPTLPTVGAFDPATQTVFSNPRARQQASIAGKAIIREHKHSEWMHELADGSAAAALETDDNDAEDYLNSELEQREKARESEARVVAQLREVKHLMDNDAAFAKTVDPQIRRLLHEGGVFRELNPDDDTYIGTVKTLSKARR